MTAPAADQIAPEGGHIPEIGHDLGDRLDHIVDLLLRCVFAEGQAQGAVRHFVRSSDRQQHVTGIQRARCAGGAGGGGDPFVVEQQQERFAFNAFKTEVHVAGQALLRISVQR